LVHPKKESLNQLGDLTPNKVKKGFYYGWEAHRLLYNAIGRPHTENSWDIICDRHNIPADSE
jgi:hypothetical protein